MPTDIHASEPATTDRPGRRVLVGVLLPLLVVTMVLAATTIGLVLHLRPAHRIDSALTELREWSSVNVRGYLVGTGEPMHIDATVTADGAARGVLSRPLGARAEFAAGRAGTVLRGNRQWWLDGQPGRAEQLADRWIRDLGAGPVERLAPAALADALNSVREPAGRTAIEVRVGDAGGTAYVRNGVRLVVGWTGRPLAVAIPTLTSPALVPDRAPSADSGWSTSVIVERSDPIRDAAVRGAVDDVLAAQPPGSVLSLGEIEQQGTADRIDIKTESDPRGCSAASCILRAQVRNGSAVAKLGVFSARLGGTLVSEQPMTVPAGGTVDVTVRVPPAVVAALPARRVKIQFSFRIDDGVSPDPGFATILDRRGLATDQALVPGQPNGPSVLRMAEHLTRDQPGGIAGPRLAELGLRTVAGSGTFGAVLALLESGRQTNAQLRYSLLALDRPGAPETLRQAALHAQQEDVGWYPEPGGDAPDIELPAHPSADRDRVARAVVLEVVTASGPAALRTALATAADRARRIREPLPGRAERAVYLEIRPGAAEGMDVMSAAELRERLIRQRAIEFCQVQRAMPTIDVIRIINQDPDRAGDREIDARAHEFWCRDLTV